MSNKKRDNANLPMFTPVAVYKSAPDQDPNALTRFSTDNPLGIRILYPEEELNEQAYDRNTIFYIQCLYIILSVLWIALFWWLKLYDYSDIVIWALLFLPLLVFALSFANISRITDGVEKEVLGSNYLSFGFLIVVILINWNTPLETKNKTEFFSLIVFAFGLIMISMIDVWVTKSHMSWWKHLRTSLQTMALVLLVLALYIYYKAQRKVANYL